MNNENLKTIIGASLCDWEIKNKHSIKLLN